MQTKNKIISPAKFIGIITVFGLIISAVVIFFAIPNLRSSFAINEISIDYKTLETLQPSNRIQLYFNKGVDPSYRDSNALLAKGDVDFRDIIINRIENAKETIDLANEEDIALISSPFGMFELAGRLYKAGLPSLERPVGDGTCNCDE